MDAVANPILSTDLISQNQVHAYQLQSAFDFYSPKIKVLSLDCFDTLLWRKCATPIDIFYDVEQHPAFKSCGFTAYQRVSAESKARLINVIEKGTNEVTLKDIYLTNLPELTATEIQDLENAEISREIETCYPFPPVMDLIRKAHAQGIKVIIVSDTYLTHAQLQHLLKSTLPDDVMQAIDIIFPSNTYGRSKPNGLFKFVLEKLNLSPQSILHIGDNPVADLHAAVAYQLNALQLLHNNTNISSLLRMEEASATLLDPSIRYTRSLSSPFRGALANASITNTEPEYLIGYASIGPIMYTFARFLADEVAALKQQGKNPKVLFLMRDAYLPYLACNALNNTEFGKRVYISRFSSYASSFRTRKDIERYIFDVVTSNRYSDIAKQLLLPPAVAEPILATISKAEDPTRQFLQLIFQPNVINIIIKKSTAYRARLVRHLEKVADIKAGDTLMLVDLGYSGTTQRLLEPIFRDELKIDIIGRYLIALGVPGWQHSRRGLMDPSWCDERTLLALVYYIALVEQICTSNESSVIDYEDDGSPIYTESKLSKTQHSKLDFIQSACIDFVKNTHQYFNAMPKSFAIETLRDTALAAVGRFLYLPSENEINYLKSFEFELNLGTEDVFRVFDEEQGLQSLRKRGMFFAYMEKTLKSIRMNYPAELRAAGLELAVTFMAQHRYGLAFNATDCSLRKESLQIIAIQDNNTSQPTIDATPTHDGYFSMAIPIGNGNIKIGVLFGHKYQWVQIESIETIQLSAYLNSTESHYAEDCWANTHFNQMIDKGGRLFECTANTSLMMVAPTVKTDGQNYVCRIVFRPITRWTPNAL